MSLDLWLDYDGETVYHDNITHNLNDMAAHAGLYEALWRPEELHATRAKDILPVLRVGLSRLNADPEYFKQYEPSNGWGDYEGLVEFVAGYLKACADYPKATISIWR